MTDQDFSSEPVPIRMTCRYGNSININYFARALWCGAKSLRVLSPEPFEKNVQLIVVAPFLSGRTICSVARSTGHRGDSAFFELELKFAGEPAMAQPEREKVGKAAFESLPKDLADLVAAARDLADRLEQAKGGGFSETWHGIPLAKRRSSLVAGVCAGVLLLQKKGYLDVRHALAVAKEARKR